MKYELCWDDGMLLFNYGLFDVVFNQGGFAHCLSSERRVFLANFAAESVLSSSSLHQCVYQPVCAVVDPWHPHRWHIHPSSWSHFGSLFTASPIMPPYHRIDSIIRRNWYNFKNCTIVHAHIMFETFKFNLREISFIFQTLWMIITSFI